MEIRGYKPWEVALAAGVLCAVIFGFWAQSAQEELSGKLVRLHVVANSDGVFDQQVKLRVRDSVLETARYLLDGVGSADEAAVILEDNLQNLTESAGRALSEAGCGMDVSVSLAQEEFPTREYDTFVLPAGSYQSLRVTIGEGDGRNWWCVVFPPLCDAGGSVGTSAKEAGFTDGEVALIEEADGVKIKFRCIEIWQRIKKML